jgi:hypothetical protein
MRHSSTPYFCERFSAHTSTVQFPVSCVELAGHACPLPIPLVIDLRVEIVTRRC